MTFSNVWRPALLALVLTVALTGTASAAVTQLTMHPTAKLSPGHLHAILTGTVTCDPGDNLLINGQIVQPQTASGFGFANASSCDGTPQAFAVDVSTGGIFGAPGVFKPGKASAQVSTSICDPGTMLCSSKYTDGMIRLVK